MKSLRTKLMITMLALALFITVVLSMVAISSINDSTEGTLISSVSPLTTQASKSLNSAVRQYIYSFLNAVQSDSTASSENEEDMLTALRAGYSDEMDEYSSFTVFSASGELLASDDSDAAQCISAQDIADAAQKSTCVYTDLVELDGEIYFSVLQSAQLNSDSVVAAVTINADVLVNDILENSFGENGYGYLVDKNANVLLHEDKQTALDNFNAIEQAKSDDDYEQMAQAMQTVISGGSGTCTYSFDGQKCIVGYSQIDYFDGILVLVIVADNFNSATGSAMRNIIIIGILAIVITAIISLWHASRISKPIISATKRIRLLAQGNLSDPVDVWYSKDELGVLTNSLEETIVSLRQYINLINVALTQISEGNLCHRMEGTFKGDFQQIKSTYNDIMDGLSDTFASINTAAEQVTSGAVQVSNSAQAVSQGSTQQASAIEELSVTLNDVAKQIQQNSNDAKNAYNIVTDNTNAIGSCNDDMENMLNAINAIHTSSSEISKIIKVIDEIAFQTNILALNAAVEAAREGSKGFGVVADEVRRLASRSAEAAKQTASLIENSAAAVSRGNEIAQKTASSLKVIVDSSNEIQSLVKNISDASEDQTESIVQINTGLDQISAVVSANTSTSVGTASASEELSSQSLILKNMIARFKLRGDTGEHRKGRFEYEYTDIPEVSDMPLDFDSQELDEFVTDSDKY